MRAQKLGWLGLFVIASVLLLPASAKAQSTIAGVVKDTSGAVLPGVTVEASSPVLIERSRSAVTDAQGQYRVVDLRPGTYVVTFTLPGFSTVKREGIELPSNFTANIPAEMKVGGIEETLTVTGASPVVDVHSAQNNVTLNKELLDTLPAERTWDTNTVPAVLRSGTVGGSGAMTHDRPMIYGLALAEVSIDGMNAMPAGTNPGLYFNYGANEEVVYQVSGGSAEVQTGGMQVNMIPKTGGNSFEGEGTAIFANHSMTTDNNNDALRKRGLATSPGFKQVYDYGASLGGPVMRDKLWFFSSVRDWATNQYIANIKNPDGSQASEANQLWSFTNRLTYHVNASNKITGMFDKEAKNIDFYYGLGLRDAQFTSPEATVAWYTGPWNAVSQLKWTSTASSKLLIEAGYSQNLYESDQFFQDSVVPATCHVRFDQCPSGTNYGTIAKRDLITGRVWDANINSEVNRRHTVPKIIGSVSYITGSHQLKAGAVYGWGNNRTTNNWNADIVQFYRNGVPDSVDVHNSPNDSLSTLNEQGVYIQDSWTRRRLTINPGVRYDLFHAGYPDQNPADGRFVQGRHFPAVKNLIHASDFSPRFGAAYDLFGNGKTAIRGSVGKYIDLWTSEAGSYVPSVASTDNRTWRDANGNNIAEENELGPTTNLAFGLRRKTNPDPDLTRPFTLFYSVGVQQEVRPGVGLTVTYNRRGFHNQTWTDNLPIGPEDYTLITIPDPRGSGTLPVYNLNPAKNGLVDEVVKNSSAIKRTYDGVDMALTGRFSGGTFTVANSLGRIVNVNCAAINDANQLRFCDESKYGLPFHSSFRILGLIPLPYKFTFSGVYQSTPNTPNNDGIDELNTTYSVNRTLAPGLTQATVNVRLNEPGTKYRPRINQLDLVVGRNFRVGGIRVLPKIEVHNALNAAPVVNEITTWGSALSNVVTILPGRIARFNLQINF